MNALPAVQWYRYESLDSTSSEARRLLQSGALTVPAAVMAARQTAGRGRQGKTFYSPADTGIYMSIVTRFPQDANAAALLTLRTCVAVADAIREETGIETGIKWVNDLYAGSRKICGILTESVFYAGNRYAIIGIGINVSTERFPAELGDKAGSLGASARHCLHTLPSAVLAHVLRTPVNVRRDLEEYKKHSLVLGKEVTYERGGVLKKGRAVDIDGSGALLIDLGGGNRDLLQSGEISLRTWQ